MFTWKELISNWFLMSCHGQSHTTRSFQDETRGRRERNTWPHIGMHVFPLDYLWVECFTCDQNVASSNLDRSNRRLFFSAVNFTSRLLFGVHSTPVLLQWHVKDPGHSAKSAGGRLHLNTYTPLTQRSWSGLTMPLCRHSLEPIRKEAYTQLVREHSSQIA